MNRPLKLILLPEHFAIARLDPAAKFPDWIISETFYSVTRTGDELSIIAPQNKKMDDLRAQRGFRCLKVEGPLDFDEIGILSSLSAILAEAEIPILAISTFETDYIMIQQKKIKAALAQLKQSGNEIVTAEEGWRP